ncbi:uncharacterized protein ASCRUDRAFT_149539 [Ascoidea rubescens DSM 1968]|uniref:Mug135-like C-terminal domain-containing protein n=1 Tax=Ascoidea rubescens DSM 1968 TaxID=1344418 RepID=A0A1D2VGI3_9ASCO|nr:hypothetical protein ASCRUDRAFT_149539 [Ascoidea rubescens DSM 1968]ODV60692.1 hypothetical protein ASCRUDRAFT_149539 [Ascoidea rubescens DSM 1968]
MLPYRQNQPDVNQPYQPSYPAQHTNPNDNQINHNTDKNTKNKKNTKIIKISENTLNPTIQNIPINAAQSPNHNRTLPHILSNPTSNLNNDHSPVHSVPIGPLILSPQITNRNPNHNHTQLPAKVTTFLTNHLVSSRQNPVAANPSPNPDPNSNSNLPINTAVSNVPNAPNTLNKQIRSNTSSDIQLPNVFDTYQNATANTLPPPISSYLRSIPYEYQNNSNHTDANIDNSFYSNTPYTTRNNPTPQSHINRNYTPIPDYSQNQNQNHDCNSNRPYPYLQDPQNYPHYQSQNQFHRSSHANTSGYDQLLFNPANSNQNYSPQNLPIPHNSQNQSPKNTQNTQSIPPYNLTSPITLNPSSSYILSHPPENLSLQVFHPPRPVQYTNQYRYSNNQNPNYQSPPPLSSRQHLLRSPKVTQPTTAQINSHDQSPIYPRHDSESTFQSHSRRTSQTRSSINTASIPTSSAFNHRDRSSTTLSIGIESLIHSQPETETKPEIFNQQRIRPLIPAISNVPICKGTSKHFFKLENKIALLKEVLCNNPFADFNNWKIISDNYNIWTYNNQPDRFYAANNYLPRKVRELMNDYHKEFIAKLQESLTKSKNNDRNTDNNDSDDDDDDDDDEDDEDNNDEEMNLHQVSPSVISVSSIPSTSNLHQRRLSISNESDLLRIINDNLNNNFYQMRNENNKEFRELLQKVYEIQCEVKLPENKKKRKLVTTTSSNKKILLDVVSKQKTSNEKINKEKEKETEKEKEKEKEKGKEKEKEKEREKEKIKARGRGKGKGKGKEKEKPRGKQKQKQKLKNRKRQKPKVNAKAKSKQIVLNNNHKLQDFLICPEGDNSGDSDDSYNDDDDSNRYGDYNDKNRKKNKNVDNKGDTNDISQQSAQSDDEYDNSDNSNGTKNGNENSEENETQSNESTGNDGTGGSEDSDDSYDSNNYSYTAIDLEAIKHHNFYEKSNTPIFLAATLRNLEIINNKLLRNENIDRITMGLPAKSVPFLNKKNKKDIKLPRIRTSLDIENLSLKHLNFYLENYAIEIDDEFKNNIVMKKKELACFLGILAPNNYSDLTRN